jgi:hypothetical protein
MKSSVLRDPEVDALFKRASSELTSLFGYSEEEASILVADYLRLFTDKIYCEQMGIPTQDDDFFFHEAPLGMALRIQFFCGLKERSEAHFLAWREKIVTKIKEQQRGSLG